MEATTARADTPCWHKKRTARVWPAAAILAMAYALAIGADFVAPYGYAEQHRTYPFAPPTRLRLVDPTGTFHWRPFVHPLMPVPGTLDEYQVDRSLVCPVRLWVRGEPNLPGGDGGRRLAGVDAPCHLFLLGTDRFGRDFFSRLLYGARISLFSGLLAGVLAVVLGLAIGVLAGYFGGLVDDIAMRGSELFMALPWLYLLLAVRAFLPLHVSPTQAFFLLVGVIGLVGWAGPARLVRGIALSARERDFVRAARGFGASDLYILWRHVVSQTRAVAATQFALLVPGYILAEVTLSFLGLGVAEPVPSWGNLLAELQQYHVLISYHWMLSPAVVLIVVILSYHRLANALQQRWGRAVV